jgi:hypothetical protein
MRKPAMKTPTSETKWCAKCEQWKPLSAFSKRTSRPIGVHPICKICDSARVGDKNLERKFGITREDYNRMLDAQGGACAICGTSASDARRLAVDHDHETDQVRALLCGECNLGLGKFQDNPGRHLSPLKDDGIILISEAEANRRWMLQTLTGDTSDGYKGIPKIGPKRAAAILGNARTLAAMWRAVVTAYRDTGLTEDDALMTARVARILRNSDYDKTTKEIVLWHPTTPQRLALKKMAG